MKCLPLALSALLLIPSAHADSDYEKMHRALAKGSPECRLYRQTRPDMVSILNFLKENKLALGAATGATLVTVPALAYGGKAMLAVNEKLNPGVTKLIDQYIDLSAKAGNVEHGPKIQSLLNKMGKLRYFAKVGPKLAIVGLGATGVGILLVGAGVALEVATDVGLTGSSRERIAEELEADPAKLYYLSESDACGYLFDFPHVKAAFEELIGGHQQELD